MRCLIVVFLNESEIVFSVPLTNTILVIYVAEFCTYRSSKLTKKTDGIAKRASSNDFEQEPEHDVLWVLNFSTLHPTDHDAFQSRRVLSNSTNEPTRKRGEIANCLSSN